MKPPCILLCILATLLGYASTLNTGNNWQSPQPPRTPKAESFVDAQIIDIVADPAPPTATRPDPSPAVRTPSWRTPSWPTTTWPSPAYPEPPNPRPAYSNPSYQRPAYSDAGYPEHSTSAYSNVPRPSTVDPSRSWPNPPRPAPSWPPHTYPNHANSGFSNAPRPGPPMPDPTRSSWPTPSWPPTSGYPTGSIPYYSTPAKPPSWMADPTRSWPSPSWPAHGYAGYPTPPSYAPKPASWVGDPVPSWPSPAYRSPAYSTPASTSYSKSSQPASWVGQPTNSWSTPGYSSSTATSNPPYSKQVGPPVSNTHSWSNSAYSAPSPRPRPVPTPVVPMSAYVNPTTTRARPSSAYEPSPVIEAVAVSARTVAAMKLLDGALQSDARAALELVQQIETLRSRSASDMNRFIAELLEEVDRPLPWWTGLKLLATTSCRARRACLVRVLDLLSFTYPGSPSTTMYPPASSAEQRRDLLVQVIQSLANLYYKKDDPKKRKEYGHHGYHKYDEVYDEVHDTKKDDIPAIVTLEQRAIARVQQSQR